MPELCLPQVRVLKGINTYGMERYIYIAKGANFDFCARWPMGAEVMIDS